MRVDAMRAIGWGIAALLCIFVLMAVRATWHWGIADDAPLMLFVARALHGGATPYRDILDMKIGRASCRERV